MFNLIFKIVLLVVICSSVMHYVYLRFFKKYTFSKPDVSWIWPINFEKLLKNFWKLIGVLISLAILVCFVILFISGFYNPLVKGENISGYIMMIHVPVSGAFSVLFILYLIFTSERMRLNFHMPLTSVQQDKQVDNLLQSIMKLSFWVLCILFVPLLLSILLSMFKVFGTEAQHMFMEMHKVTAAIFTVIGIVFLYTALISSTCKSAK